MCISAIVASLLHQLSVTTRRINSDYKNEYADEMHGQTKRTRKRVYANGLETPSEARSISIATVLDFCVNIVVLRLSVAI